MRRRATAAVSGLRRRLSPGQVEAPSVPIYFNLLPEADLWPKMGRVGEQRLMLVQYWRQMQREMSPEAAGDSPRAGAGTAAAPASVNRSAPPRVIPAPAADTPHIPPISEFDDDELETIEVAPAKAEAPVVEAPRVIELPAARANWVPASELFANPSEPERPAEPATAAPVSIFREGVEPVAVEPAVQSFVAEPAVVEPVVAEPIDLEPIALEPVMLEPVALEPIAAEPIALDPIALEPEPGEAPATEEPFVEAAIEMPALVSIELDVPVVAASADVAPDETVFELPDTLFADMATESFAERPAASVAEFDFAPPMAGELVFETEIDLVRATTAEPVDVQPFAFNSHALVQADEVEQHVAAVAVSETFEPDAFSADLAVEEMPLVDLPGHPDPVFHEVHEASDFAVPVFEDDVVEPMAQEELVSVDVAEPVLAEPAEAGFLPEPDVAEPIVEEVVAVEMPALVAGVVPHAETGEPAEEALAAAVEVEMPALVAGALPQADSAVERGDEILAAAAGDVEMPALMAAAAAEPDWQDLALQQTVPVVADAEPVTVSDAGDEFAAELHAAAATFASAAELAILAQDIDPPAPSDAAVLADAAEWSDEPFATPLAPLAPEPAEPVAVDTDDGPMIELPLAQPDAAFAAATAAAAETSRAFDLSDGGRAMPAAADMPVPTADPVWNDAMTEWTISARDIRLRRSGVIPMPIPRPVRRSPVPALERFRRAAEQRKQRVAAESVA